MKKILFFVVLALTVSACDNMNRAPLGDTGYVIVNEKGTTSFGVLDQGGQQLLPMQFTADIKYYTDQKLFHATESTAPAMQHLIAADATALFAAPKLERVGNLWKGIYGKQMAIYDPAKKLTTAAYDEILIGLNQFIVKNNGLIGVLTRDGKTILPVEFKELYVMDDGTNHCYVVYNEKKKFYERYDAEGKKTKTVYYKKTFDNMKAKATKTWAGGFTVKKI